MARKSAFACALAVALAAGCGSDRATRGEGSIEVATTSAPLADIVRNAGGRRVRVTILRPTVGPAGADVLVLAGGGADSWASSYEAERVLTLLPKVDPLGVDPFWWLDPVRVQRAVKEIRNELARADVDGAGYYEAASADFLARLRRLDREIRGCLARVQGARERLAAPHDPTRYFTARYGVPFHSLRRATVRLRLKGDTLGPRGTPSDSYLGAMSADTEAIVHGLTDGAQSCRPRP
jgi:ABC-type Zn uptake system ZnuABC Zn-binding protein ZnuA